MSDASSLCSGHSDGHPSLGECHRPGRANVSVGMPVTNRPQSNHCVLTPSQKPYQLTETSPYSASALNASVGRHKRWSATNWTVHLSADTVITSGVTRPYSHSPSLAAWLRHVAVLRHGSAGCWIFTASETAQVVLKAGVPAEPVQCPCTAVAAPDRPRLPRSSAMSNLPSP